MKTIRFSVIFLILLLGTSVFSQQLTQTVRGTLIDFDSKLPIIGAKVMIPNSEPFKAAITDVNGDFRLEEVPVGRIALMIKSLGYQDVYVSNLLIESGKEKVLNLEMTVDVKVLTAVEVSSQQDKSESINKMAIVSAKTFTVEETSRYSGTFNDPARMVSGFAGVVGNADGDNDIVVRGNSPRGILWRLDGIDIPNPNHFAGQGSTGGPVNALNGAVLANSDFFSGAFAPEYGNALSGVFDVKYRTGNNEQREYSFSAGVLGLDGTVEGPFKKGYRGSYLINYRYSSLALLDKAGILDFDGIPLYQDMSFKFLFPTKKMGTFSIIGLGGKSHIFQTDDNDSTGAIYSTLDLNAHLGVVALKHTYIITPKMYVKSYVSASSESTGEIYNDIKNDSTGLYKRYDEKYIDYKIKAQSIVNYNWNKKNTFQAGVTYTHLEYDFFFNEDLDEGGTLTPLLKSKGGSDMIQSFISWKYRITNELSIVSGVNHLHFFLNDNFTIEPRASMKWQLSKRQDFSVGFGMHSRMESVSTYLYNDLQTDGTYFYPNKDLDFSKSIHYVVGYGLQISENLRLKSEIYYQQLYNLPVEDDITSYFSLANSYGGIPDSKLVNKGTGKNYGIELTVERYFNNNYYYLLTGSLYKSKFTALDGVERNSVFDGNYAGNLIAGKEFKFGKTKNKTFGINTKISFIGGGRYTPVDLVASKDAGYTIRQYNKPISAKGDDILTINLGFTFRADMKRASHSFKIDFQNLTNNKAKLYDYYDSDLQVVDYGTQLPIVPNLIYTIKF